MIFSLDAAVAFLVMCTMMFYLFATASLVAGQAADNTKKFLSYKKLLDASELLVSSPERGLAERRENAVKHHELISDPNSKSGLLNKENLLLEKDFGITIKVRGESLPLLSRGNQVPKNVFVRRFALCGGESCVLELWSE